MNRPVIISAIAACIAALSSLGIVNTYHVNQEMQSKLIIAENAAIDGNPQQALEMSNEIQNYWEQKEKWLLLYIKHNEIDEINKSISELQRLIQFGDTAEFCSKVSQTSALMEHVWQSELPLLKNIL